MVGEEWRDLFSQYLTTAAWVAEALCEEFPTEPIAVYAGGSASFIQQGNERRSAGREQIKEAIQRGDLRLVCATDAACEGLNLQKLGAQVNVDLPWNPSRLEQRKGRVQRIGQVRDEIQDLSLRYAGTVEDEVYATLSDRLGDIFSVLGQLPGNRRSARMRRMASPTTPVAPTIPILRPIQCPESWSPTAGMRRDLVAIRPGSLFSGVSPLDTG